MFKEISLKLRELADIIEKSNEREDDSALKSIANKKISFEDIQSILASKVLDGKSKEIKKILDSFGVKKLGEISEDNYPELLKKAEEL